MFSEKDLYTLNSIFNMMSWKKEFIEKHGEDTYNKRLAQRKAWGESLPGGEKKRSQDRRDADPEKFREADSRWRKRNPEKVKEKGRQVSQKDGKYYEKKQLYKKTGLSGERERVRMRHGYKYRPYKKIIDPLGLSQIHHEWIPGTAEYRGVALVEKDQHMHRFVDVIDILEGGITLVGSIRQKK